MIPQQLDSTLRNIVSSAYRGGLDGYITRLLVEIESTWGSHLARFRLADVF